MGMSREQDYFIHILLRIAESARMQGGRSAGE